MNHDQRPFAPGDRKDVEHLPVVKSQQIIGHIDLERRVPIADQGGQFLAQDLLRRVRDDQMKGVVDDRFWSGGRVVLLDDLAQRLAAMLRGKRDYRGGPAKRRRHRSAIEIVGADDPGRGALLDMTMAVDAARQYQMAARIDVPRARTKVLS